MATGQYTDFPIDWKSLDASQVPYSNSTSGLSATDVQGAIDELNTDLNAIDASDVPYDNTASGLTADDVQEALDELASEKQDILTAGDGITISSDTISTDNDATLTSAVKPAQAKAVGDALASIGETLKADFAPVITDTASGAIASFPDGADSYPLKECVVNIEAIQSGSGDPSPENVRPITGFSEAKVTRCGKNLCNVTMASQTSANLTWTRNADGATGTIVGTASNTNVNVWFNGNYTIRYKILFVPANTKVSLTDCIVFGHYADSTLLISFGSISLSDSVRKATFTPTRDFWIDGIRCPAATVGTYYNLTLAPMVEFSSTPTEFEPYKGQTYTISLGDTRYGCTLDVTRGKLRVTHKFFSYTSATLYGNYGVDNKPLYYVNIPDVSTQPIKDGSSADLVPLLSNYFGFTTGARAEDLGDNEIRTQGGVSIGRFYFRADAYNGNITAVNADFSSTPLQVVAELVNPIEVDLTPTEITTLLGENNIFADTGDVEVEYCADTKRYIQKLISQLA